jgi:hypothetical protein
MALEDLTGRPLFVNPALAQCLASAKRNCLGCPRRPHQAMTPHSDNSIQGVLAIQEWKYEFERLYLRDLLIAAVDKGTLS